MEDAVPFQVICPGLRSDIRPITTEESIHRFAVITFPGGDRHETSE
jgi:hypothetical protein